MYSVIGIGSPIVDYITHVSTSFLEEIGVQVGTMQVVQKDYIANLLKRVTGFTKLPGGSIANTLRGVSWLLNDINNHETNSLFIGAVGKDNNGGIFQKSLEKEGVFTSFCYKNDLTSESVILVTPDGERTMMTYLGASQLLDYNCIPQGVFEGSEFFYADAYMFEENKSFQTLDKCVKEANFYNSKVIFDLADPLVVKRNLSDLKDWIGNKVMVLMGNREEFYSFTGKTDDNQAIGRASKYAEVVIMKTGNEGARVKLQSREVLINTDAVTARDSTGAGDAFAAGFIVRFKETGSIIEAVKFGNSLAGLIVKVDGCNYQAINRKKLVGS